MHSRMSRMNQVRIAHIFATLMLCHPAISFGSFNAFDFSSTNSAISTVTQSTLSRFNEYSFNPKIGEFEFTPKAASPHDTPNSPTTLASYAKQKRGAYKTPAALASKYPPNKRDQAEKLFLDLLLGYQAIEEKFGIPRHDTAGAVAAFISGSYMAYGDSDLPDAHFPQLVEQVRHALKGNRHYSLADNQHKQEVYEQMAILGMFMATTRMALQEKPNPQLSANLREAAKKYLEQFLKTDIGKIRITAQGLIIQ
jgi:hypothetical protein